ncbi:MAG: nucleotidyltransferase domain-containing protein [Nanoarchaeota archaeon]
MLTKNEKKVIRTILFSFGEEYSINEIARKCNLAPNGALKILRKFLKEGIITMKKIANINSHTINFNNPKTKSILELSLMQEGNNKVKNRVEDLKKLQEITEAGIIFGSYITEKENPEDIDLLFVLNKDNFKKYKEEIKKIFPIMPIKVHDVLQTKEDLEANILKKDKVIEDILKKGFILWGHDKIVEAIKNGHSR